jgi:hypothetical protein
MRKNHKIILTSVLTVIIIFSGFTFYEIETEPQFPSLKVIPANELYNKNYYESLAWSPPPRNNITGSNYSYYANTTSTMNASYGGSNASFLFYEVFSPLVSFTKDSSYCMLYGLVKTGQNLSFPVTGFSFSIKNFIVAYNNSVITNADKITPEVSCIQDGTLLSFSGFFPIVMPFSFTIGNFSAVNRYYYVNYSFEFTPIVEIGFIHFALKPIHVKNYFLAPWGFKTPQKPWWEKQILNENSRMFLKLNISNCRWNGGPLDEKK